MVWCTQDHMCWDGMGWDEESQEMFDEELPEGSMRTCKRHQQRCQQVDFEAWHVQKVFDGCRTKKRQYIQRIVSSAHYLYTYDMDKVSLCPFDDKMYVLEDKINTLAYGHFNIKN